MVTHLSSQRGVVLRRHTHTLSVIYLTNSLTCFFSGEPNLFSLHCIIKWQRRCSWLDMWLLINQFRFIKTGNVALYMIHLQAWKVTKLSREDEGNLTKPWLMDWQWHLLKFEALQDKNLSERRRLWSAVTFCFLWHTIWGENRKLLLAPGAS